MARRKYPKQVSPVVLLEYAKKAVENAEAVADEARLLAAHERWPRAVALMILAREELAKGGYASQLSLGGMPLEKDSLTVLLGGHKKKHAQSGLPDVDWLFFPLRAVVEALSAAHKLDEVNIDSPEGEEVAEALLAIVRPVVLAQLNANPADRLGDVVADIKLNWTELLDKSRLEGLERDAFHVDISPDGETVLTPERTTQTAFQEQLAAYERMHALISAMLIDNLASASMDLVRTLLTSPSARPSIPAGT